MKAAVIALLGTLPLIDRERLRRLRAQATQDGKRSPSMAEAIAMVPPDMVCPHCSRVMVWWRREDASRVMSLQHWRDGSMTFICHGCNARHRDMPSDEIFKALTADTKYCSICKTIKPLAGFSTSGNNRPMSYCKPCDSARVVAARRNKEALCG